MRWSEGYARVAELAGERPQTRLVYVADRESDMLELMVRARDLGIPVDWLVRSKTNRALPDGDKLWDSVIKDAPLGEIRFILPKGREPVSYTHLLRYAFHPVAISTKDTNELG